ncbi:MAG: hypothetical protein NTW73_01435 [Candidatus Parcubacteria bacterium]|nr:hypothetical protein [Candidatus Parcubacteria bacterium]
MEYFISTHGGRKGLADTALKTAEAGYLTRRLVDVSQDIIVNKDDCGTNNGVTISRNLDNASESKDFRYKIFGRIIAQDVADKKNKVSLKRGDLVTGDLADKIEKSEITSVMVRTPLTCRAHYGVCQQCYGLDLARNRLVQKGEAVGIVAAQAIGEPGTQLTLRTHQSGGVSNAIDITQGLPRVEELFEARSPKGEVPIAKNDGVIKEISEDGDEWVIRVLNDKKNVAKLKKKGARVKKKDLLLESNEEEYRIPKNSKMFDFVKEGSKVEAGSQFSEGSLNLKDILSILGREATQRYIIIEAKKVYDIAGELIHDKHLEVIVRQMFSKARIINPGDSHFLQGEIVSKSRYFEENALLKKKKKKPATAVQIIMGISKVALSSESFLSAASFQETSRVLIGASLEGKVDYLRGLKENVIIGRLIPAGTGYKEEETE